MYLVPGKIGFDIWERENSYDGSLYPHFIFCEPG